MRIFRSVYIILSWAIIFNTTPSTSGLNAFIVSIFIFSFGMLYDYTDLYYSGKKLNDKMGNKKYQIGLGIIGIFISLIYVLSCLLLWMGVFNIKEGVNICTTGNDLREGIKLISVNLYQYGLAVFIALSFFEIYNKPHRRSNAQLAIAESANTEEQED